MTPELLISYATLAASFILSAAFLLTVYRVIVGPTLPDRVIALDMLVGIAIGFIAVIAIRTAVNLYVDIAIALALVGFLATVAFARFILSRKSAGQKNQKTRLDGAQEGVSQASAKIQPKKTPSDRKTSSRKKRGK